MSNPKCGKCNKTVYPMEMVKAIGKAWHKMCFKCSECDLTLNLKTFKSAGGMPFCNVHMPKAGHTAVADSVDTQRAVNAPKAVRRAGDIKKDKRMSFYPGRGRGGGRGRGRGRGRGAKSGASRPAAKSGAVAAASRTFGGGVGKNVTTKAVKKFKIGGVKKFGGAMGTNKCALCSKTVYPMEKITACGSDWHKTCFKCSECGLTLNLKTHIAFEGTPYCRVHVPKVRHTQVADDVNTARATSAPKKKIAGGVNKTKRMTFMPGQRAVDDINTVPQGNFALERGNENQSTESQPTMRSGFDYNDEEAAKYQGSSWDNGGGGGEEEAWDEGGEEYYEEEAGGWGEEAAAEEAWEEEAPADDGGWGGEAEVADDGGWAEEAPADDWAEEAPADDGGWAEEAPAAEEWAEEAPADDGGWAATDEPAADAGGDDDEWPGEWAEDEDGNWYQVADEFGNPVGGAEEGGWDEAGADDWGDEGGDDWGDEGGDDWEQVLR